MRRILVLLALCAFLGGCTGSFPLVTGTPTASAKQAPTAVVMPNVVGQNAAVAEDGLRKLGFTNIDLGTVDGRPLVLLPQNWTVKTQSAKPGDKLPPDAKIVLGCARNG